MASGLVACKYCVRNGYIAIITDYYNNVLLLTPFRVLSFDLDLLLSNNMISTMLTSIDNITSNINTLPTPVISWYFVMASKTEKMITKLCQQGTCVNCYFIIFEQKM